MNLVINAMKKNISRERVVFSTAEMVTIEIRYSEYAALTFE